MSNTLDDSNGPVTTEPIHDLYLQMLIKVLETDETNTSSVSVTLMTDGGLIYGHLVTRAAWKGLWAKQMQSATGTNVEPYKTFPDTVDAVLDSVREESGQEDPDGGPRYFIHLRDATLIAPGGLRIKVPSWRGRLDSLAGWSIGTPNEE